MTCNITDTQQLDFEPLPLYQRDPETSSIISSAPSYRSDAPTYHSRCSTLVDANAAPPQYIISTSLLDISAPPRRRQTTSSSNNNNTNNNTSTTRNNAATGESRDATAPRPQGLPAPRNYAPGFESRSAHYIEPNTMSTSSASINHWSSINSSHARQQYQNVARRRASRAVGMQTAQRTVALFEQTGAGLGGDAATARTPSPTSMNANARSAEALRPISPADAAAAAAAAATAVSSSPPSPPPPPSMSPVNDAPLNSSSSSPPPPISSSTSPPMPLEDPTLVGEAAARRARQQRLYREACRRHEHAERMQAEGRAWDFIFAQMSDWEDRERSWGQFRHEVDARGFGLGGGGTAFGGRLLGSGSAGAVRFMTGGGGLAMVGGGGGGGGRGHGRRFSVGNWLGGRSRTRGY